jgi:FkbM family methyltransferase
MRDGRRLYLDLRNPVSVPYLFEGHFPCEGAETELVSHITRPGDVAVDVGANVGWYASLLAREVGSQGEVHAIEPNSQVVSLLRSLSEDYACLRVHPLALAAEEGEAEFHVPDNWISGSLGEVEEHSHTERTRVSPLDGLLRKHGVEQVDFVKLDAEGGEMDVLEGAAETLDAIGAPIWMLEFSSQEAEGFEHDPAELLEPFEAADEVNYRAYRIDSRARRLRPLEVPESDEFWFNAVFVPERRLDRIGECWLPKVA